MRLNLLIPSLVLASGIIASTAVARLASGSGWLVLAGPLVLASSVLIAGKMGQRVNEGRRAGLSVPMILGAVILVASVIVAWRDPSRVVSVLPLLGVCAATPEVLAVSRRSSGRCGRALKQ